MTGFRDLGPADRATADRLLAAFDGVVLDRPSPVTSDAADDATAVLLVAAFDGVVLDRPAPVDAEHAEAGAQLVVLPVPPRRRRARWLAGAAAAAAAVLVAGAVLVGPGGSSSAWAAEPRTPTAEDIAAVGAACSAPLGRGLGELEGSGSASVGGGEAPAPTPPDLPPTTLPPLVSLDVRGDVAFAVYQDRLWTVSCVLKRDGGSWRDQGLQVGPGSATATPGIVAGGSTQLADGEQITTVSGAVPAGTVRVTFRLDDGTVVTASVVGSTWAAWFPGGSRLDPGSITAYDSAGAELPLGA